MSPALLIASSMPWGGFGEGVSADVDDVLVRYHIVLNKIKSAE
jgi:hypothetical protein